MLKLHKLRLSGFKSFVDPTTVEFAGELTAVVGPNGCGKSNLADAVIWSLGERSAKSLRGETMEDVIFGGSESRRPLGMAEVDLELATDPGFPGSDDGRLTISRRVHRSGEGEFFINGKRVRLKDIRTLLMDTGLGLRGYSLIEQGQIGMILSGKPQERRKLLEEAAGITRYKDRRRIAELKLEEARGNLHRLDDILSEVARAVRSLKRQANAARRYREKQVERAELIQRVLRGRWARVQAALAELGKDLEVHVTRDAELSASLARDEAALAAERETLEGMARELAERHRGEAQLSASIEGRQEFVKGSRTRLGEAKERLEAGVASDRRRRQRQAEIEAELAGREGREDELLSDRDRAAGEVTEDSTRLSEAQGWVAQAGGLVESRRGSLLASLNALTDLRNRLHREQVEAEKGELRKRHLEHDLEIRRGRRAEVLAGLEQARAADGENRQRVDGLETAVRDSGRDLETLRADEERLTEERHQARAALAAAEQRRDLLRELVQVRSERLDALTDALAEAGLEDPDFLAARLDVPEGWASVLDLYLGALEDAVVLPADRDALEIAERLVQAGADAALVQPAVAGDPVPAIEDAAVIDRLGRALGLPIALADALPPAFLVDGLDAAERLARNHPGVAFLTRDGIWAESGVLRIVAATRRPGLLAASEELTRIEGALPADEARLSALEGRLASVIEARGAGATRLEDLRVELEGARQELAVAEARRQDLEGGARRLEIEIGTLETEATEVERELAEIGDRQTKLATELELGQAGHAELEAAFDEAQAELDRARTEREQSNTTGASRKGRLELLEERLESHRAEVKRLRRELADLERQAEDWSAERRALEARRTEIDTSITEAEETLQGELEALAACREGLLGRQQELDGLREKTREIERRIHAQRGERDALRETLTGIRELRAGHRQDVEHLREEFRKELDSEAPREAGEAPVNLAEIEADLDLCQRTLERLGPVNLLAAEEHEEQEERHVFLSKQREDVSDSVDRLRATIRQLNEESSERFLATFTEVNEAFGTTFTELFRGGSAEMRLLDEDDPLDSGIEIVARPPGKRLQNLTLLSGGEKALTAIALLFALFRSKPSPFCLLDEVDAPLDDVNTMRFVEMLRRMSRETQFVVITHNKITMEAAARLYGVTMQERGVSQLVSVELDEIDEARSGADVHEDQASAATG